MPHRFYRTRQARHGGRYVTAVSSRFLPESVQGKFERAAHGGSAPEGEVGRSDRKVDLKNRMRERWK